MGGDFSTPHPLNCPQAQYFSPCIGKSTGDRQRPDLAGQWLWARLWSGFPGVSGHVDGPQWKGLRRRTWRP